MEKNSLHWGNVVKTRIWHLTCVQEILSLSREVPHSYMVIYRHLLFSSCVHLHSGELGGTALLLLLLPPFFFFALYSHRWFRTLHYLKRDCPLIKERLKSDLPWERCSEAAADAAAGYRSSFTAWPENAEIPLDHLSQWCLLPFWSNSQSCNGRYYRIQLAGLLIPLCTHLELFCHCQS